MIYEMYQFILYIKVVFKNGYTLYKLGYLEKKIFMF